MQSTLNKPIVTTAPSSVQQQNTQLISQNTIPQLKQKTGIIKSKVPPPVPPRGSPRIDRRTSGSSNKSIGISPRATPTSSGEPNFLNDKYFNIIRQNQHALALNRLTPSKFNQNNQRRSSTPIFFGKNRSPSCVRDWLEINNFAADYYDENLDEFKITKPPKYAAIQPRRPLPIKTAHLQRQSSFRSFTQTSGSSVRSMVDNYSKQNISQRPSAIPKLVQCEAVDTQSPTIERDNISRLLKTFEHNCIPMHIEKASSITIRIDRVDSIFDTLKRKRQINPNRKLDANGNDVAKKCEIFKSHSNLDIIEDSTYLDAFSLDGEFV